MQKNYDIPLHDIKPLVEIAEYSFEYLLLVGVVAFIIVLAFIYLFVKWLKNKKKNTLRKEHLKELKNIDISETKSAAYKLTLYGHTFKDDTPRHEKAYQELFDALAEYKYKKDVESFDEKTLHFIEIYQGMLDD